MASTTIITLGRAVDRVRASRTRMGLRVRYRFDMIGAYQDGKTAHPQMEILVVAPDADNWEPAPLGDCWFFDADPIVDCPAWIERMAK